jgi:N-hydroxyarylamine O-acetyltransferase
MFDLDAYFERIGYSGERKATLEALRGILAGHTEAIPFENLNPLMRWPVRLDIESLHRKLVRDGRGGYCFEQNLLLSYALTSIGFKVSGLAARVVWSVPEGVVSPRSHMLLRIDLDRQAYIADAGFGGLTLTGPLLLQTDVEQPTPHEPFRLVPNGEEFLMQAKMQGGWNTLYRFTLHEQLLPDYEVTNWYLSNHPDSRFVTGLLAARPASDRRYALNNTELAVHYLGGKTERRTLSSVAELRDILEGPFRVTLPKTADLDAALQGLIDRSMRPK